MRAMIFLIELIVESTDMLKLGKSIVVTLYSRLIEVIEPQAIINCALLI